MGAGLCLVLDFARQHGVVDGSGGLVADAGEDLQILFAEGVGRHHGIQVHDAEQLVVVDERHGHGGTDALHDDGTRTLKAAVHAGVRGQHGGLLRDHLAQDGTGEHDLLGAPVPRLGHAGLGNPVFHQKNDPAIGRDQIERLHDDLFEQEVDVDLQPDGPAQLVGQAQLLVVAAQGFGIADLALGQELGGAGCLDLLVNQCIGQRSLPNADPLRRLGGLAGLFLEDELRPAQHDFVAFGEDAFIDALILEERAVQTAEVAVEEVAVGLADDLRMFLGNDAVEDLDDVVGMATNGGHRAQLVFAPRVACLNDQLCHAVPWKRPIVSRHHSIRAESVTARGERWKSKVLLMTGKEAVATKCASIDTSSLLRAKTTSSFGSLTPCLRKF